MSMEEAVSDLNLVEKLKLERALGMGDGYLLGFSNRTFAEFFLGSVGVDIYDAEYDYASGSKANRMRAFWDNQSNYLVAKALRVLFDEWAEFAGYGAPAEPPEECLRIVRRLEQSAPIPDLGAVTPNAEGESFDVLARSVRDCIEKNEPETGLDRLHTFVVKYFRARCEQRGLDVGRDKPLHSLVGEYVKALRREGAIESEMAERILKSTMSTMEAFNRVRNEQSLAHDNKILGHDESLLIFSHVTSCVSFVEAIEKRLQPASSEPGGEYDDIPF
jgi:Abortive infection C-terminus